MIKRELYMNRIHSPTGGELVKVMTGIRRSGKSVMLELIKEELAETGVIPFQMTSINFEDMRYSHLQIATALHDGTIKRAEGTERKAYLFFDEVQEAEGWEEYVNSLRAVLDCDTCITGSNAKLLPGELATYIGGRYVEFVVYPFSFAKFLELYHTIVPSDPIQRCFQKYLLARRVPYLANLRCEEEPPRQYPTDPSNFMQPRDIVKRNKIRDIDLLERIIAYMTADVGTAFSTSSLARFFKNEQRTVAAETVLNYARYCCDARLSYQVECQDLQGKQILASNEKYYIADHGTREAVFDGNVKDISLILENIAYVELLRRGYIVIVDRAEEGETDFVCEKRGEKLCVWVTYLLASEDTVKRELGAYDGIQDGLPKCVVSLDESDISRNRTRHWNTRDFLLAEEWN